MNAPDDNRTAMPSPAPGEGIAGEAVMLDSVERLGSWRTNGRYTISRTHKLTGVSEAAVKDWLHSYPASVAELKPDWEDMAGLLHTQRNLLSFLELVEVLIAGKIREGKGNSYREVRKYHNTLISEWGTQFPFAHQNLLTQKERLPEPVAQVLAQMDYENDFVSRWCPMGKDQPIALDPRRGSGAPTIKGRRLRVEAIRGYFAAGESLESLASDFGLEPLEVEAALRYAFLTAI